MRHFYEFSTGYSQLIHNLSTDSSVKGNREENRNKTSLLRSEEIIKDSLNGMRKQKYPCKECNRHKILEKMKQLFEKLWLEKYH